LVKRRSKKPIDNGDKKSTKAHTSSDRSTNKSERTSRISKRKEFHLK